MSDRFSESRVFIVGVGLIGGSIAAALRSRHGDVRITGVGRSRERLQIAVERGLLTDYVSELTAELLSERCVVVMCTPVHVIQQQLVDLARLCGPDVLITDGGSVKAGIAATVSSLPALRSLFVGAHPIAGGENSGFEHSKADLFEDRLCVLTPVDNSESQTLRAQQFWETIGCRCVILDPDEHDRILAMTSHLPHVVAALMASVVRPESLAFAGTGFLDTTRVAAGDPELWTSILRGNKQHVVEGLACFEEAVKSLRGALEDERFEDVTALLGQAAAARRSMEDAR
ncbi:MAG: prephenate dehydrogenase [Fuerstiella sp.]